jgi:hypothetical protein
MPVSKILIFLFLISVGKSPDAAREFAQIKGEWTIIHVTTTDSTVTPEMLPNRLIFSAERETAARPSQSIEFSGQMKPNRKPNLLEFSSVTYLTEATEGTAHPGGKGKTGALKAEHRFTQQEKIFAIYRVTGDTMKLLIKPAQNGHAEPPKDFVTTANGREILLELRRKP